MIHETMTLAGITFDLMHGLVLVAAEQVSAELEGVFARPTHWLAYACLAAGLMSALVAGVFQSFSDFVMRGLLAAAPAGGANAMQMINRTVMRSVFLVMLLGLVPVTLALSAGAFVFVGGVPLGLIFTGTAIYLIGVFGVTVAGNVPMNNRLDRMHPASIEAADYWVRYGRDWTRLNHVRTIGSAAAATCFLIAAVALA